MHAQIPSPYPQMFFKLLIHLCEEMVQMPPDKRIDWLQALSSLLLKTRKILDPYNLAVDFKL